MKEFKYKTSFSSAVKSVISKETDIYLAKASLDKLRNLIPAVDLDRNYDLLAASSNLFNVNLFNKNDDGVDTTFALKIYKSFINKPWNLEHRRSDSIVGVILSTHITDFESDDILNEDDVKEETEPYNISIGGVIWRVVNSGLAEALESSNNILDENYNKIFCSFEVAFSDYKVVVCPANSRKLSDGRVVEDSKEAEDLSSNLRCFGGTGKLKDGSRVFRLLSGEGVGLGAGIVENPAAFVKQVAVSAETETESQATTVNINVNIDNPSKTDLSSEELEQAIERSALLSVVAQRVENLQEDNKNQNNIFKENQNNISLSNNLDVIKNKKQEFCNNSILSRKHMKINSIKDINDETIKECSASSIIEFVENEIKTASEKFAKEKREKESLAQDLDKKHKDLLETHEMLKTEIQTLKENLTRMEQEKAAKEKQEKFNVRMASFEDKFELNEEELAVVAAQIKDATDEQYSKVEASLQVLLKNKDKKVIAEKKTKQEVKASEKESEQVVLDKALDKAEKTGKEVAATTSIQSTSLKEKFAKHFGLDQFVFTK